MKIKNLLLIFIGVIIGILILRAITQQGVTGINFQPVLTGTTGSIGGLSLAVGISSTPGTATIAGAQPGMPCICVPSDGTDMQAAGFHLSCTVTSANTATVRVVADLLGTPTSKTYAVRVMP